LKLLTYLTASVRYILPYIEEWTRLESQRIVYNNN